jgi:predicted component of type VI protein secretion system
MEHLEVHAASGTRLVSLDGDRLTIGKSPENHIHLDDSSVSRLHAVIEHFPAGWIIKDVGSKNGTFINGDALLGERALRSGDEIRMGQCRLLYRTPEASETASATRFAQAAPDVTRREREILLELCRPVLEGSLLTEPASVQQIADALVVTPSAVKKHLVRLYDKFGLEDNGRRKRGRLAGEAIRRGSVSAAALRQHRASRADGAT